MFGFGLLPTIGVGLAALLLSSGGAYLYGYQRGEYYAVLEMQAASVKAIAKAAEEAHALGIAEGAITFTAGQRFAAAQTRIVTRTITQIREVPARVPPSDDAACIISAGFVRVHDDAARDPAESVPDTAGSAAGATAAARPAPRLSDVAATVARNYGTYYAVRAQMIELQGWVRQQQALHR